MAKPRALHKQSDLTRYLKAARAAGYDRPTLVMHPDGTIEIKTIEPAKDDAATGNPCDALLK